MPQVSLPTSGTVYNLYEAVIAKELGIATGTAASAEAARTSILARSCHNLNIGYPTIAAGVVLIIIQRGSEVARVPNGDGEAYTISGGGATNDVSLIDKFLKADVNNALVDVQIEVH